VELGDRGSDDERMEDGGINKRVDGTHREEGGLMNLIIWNLLDCVRHQEQLEMPKSLFGGSLTCELPPDFDDASKFRDVPDHQEVFVDMSEGERSIIIEIVSHEDGISNSVASEFFFKDYAEATDASSFEISQSEISKGQISTSACDVVTVAGQLRVSRIGSTAEKDVIVVMAVHRLPAHKAEIIIILNSPSGDLAVSWALARNISDSLRLVDTSIFK